MFPFMRRRSVFWTLMILGSVLQGMVLLLFMQDPMLFGQLLLPLLIGVFLGILISLIEVNIFIKKRMSKYKPSVVPYSGMWIFLLLNMIFSGDLEHLKIYIMGFGLYLNTLAVIFKIYEIKTNQTNITWIELLDE